MAVVSWLVHLALPSPKSLLRRDNWILRAWCSWREGGKARGVLNCYRQARFDHRSETMSHAIPMSRPFLTPPDTSRSTFSSALWCTTRTRNFRLNCFDIDSLNSNRCSMGLPIDCFRFSIDAFCRFTTRSWSKVLKRSMYAMVSEINLIFSRFRWF